ncbi:hypothetical protein K2Z84_20285 [Candidatus Binatia bacterium]|jgi:hypothetical protein|nr:hypothetical protein [Candidatus Binatia bacterium]
MLRSTRHWRPLVNGHTGYTPWWHAALITELRGLPDLESLVAVTELTAIEWIVVHRDLVPERRWNEWQTLPARVPWLKVAFADDAILLLHVERERRSRWADALALGARFRGHTALGTPLAPLSRDDAWAKLEWRTRPRRRAAAGERVSGVVRVRNAGATTWPALLRPEQPDDQLVVLEGAWWAADGTRSGETIRLRLPRDVLPGDRVGVPFDVATPTVPGKWRLTWRVRQVGGASFVLSPGLDEIIEVEAPS